MDDVWLKCKVGAGQFSNEFSVVGRRYDGREFSLFAPQDAVQTEQPVQEGRMVPGRLRVTLVRKDSDKFLVRLPREAFETGYFVAVSPSDVLPEMVGQET